MIVFFFIIKIVIQYFFFSTASIGELIRFLIIIMVKILERVLSRDHFFNSKMLNIKLSLNYLKLCYLDQDLLYIF